MPRSYNRNKQEQSATGKRRGQKTAEAMRNPDFDVRAMSDDELRRRCKAELKKDPAAYRRYLQYLSDYSTRIGHMSSSHFLGH